MPLDTAVSELEKRRIIQTPLGVTESRVSQLHTQAVLRLRAELRSQELLDDI
jgi:DNA-directed RNA polymerase specialized sigma subunit